MHFVSEWQPGIMCPFGFVGFGNISYIMSVYLSVISKDYMKIWCVHFKKRGTSPPSSEPHSQQPWRRDGTFPGGGEHCPLPGPGGLWTTLPWRYCAHSSAPLDQWSLTKEALPSYRTASGRLFRRLPWSFCKLGCVRRWGSSQRRAGRRSGSPEGAVPAALSLVWGSAWLPSGLTLSRGREGRLCSGPTFAHKLL